MCSRDFPNDATFACSLAYHKQAHTNYSVFIVDLQPNIENTTGVEITLGVLRWEELELHTLAVFPP